MNGTAGHHRVPGVFFVLRCLYINLAALSHAGDKFPGAAADAVGESLNDFICMAIDERMERK